MGFRMVLLASTTPGRSDNDAAMASNETGEEQRMAAQVERVPAEARRGEARGEWKMRLKWRV